MCMHERGHACQSLFACVVNKTLVFSFFATPTDIVSSCMNNPLLKNTTILSQFGTKQTMLVLLTTLERASPNDSERSRKHWSCKL